MKLLISRDLKISTTKQMSAVSVPHAVLTKNSFKRLIVRKFCGQKLLTLLEKSGSRSYQPNLIL